MVEINSIKLIPGVKQGEIQRTELPTIIQEIIRSRVNELKALLGPQPLGIAEIVKLMAEETLKARENLDAYLIQYLHDKLYNGEDLIEEEFNFLFEKEEREEALTDEDRIRLLDVKNLFIQVNKWRLKEYNFSSFKNLL